MNTEIQLMKIQLTAEKEHIQQAELKSHRQFSSDPSSASKHIHYKKWVKEEDLYCIKDYPHYWQYVHQIETVSIKGCLSEFNHYLNYCTVKCWITHHNEKSLNDT